MNFRVLNADEIECRVSSISEKGLSLLLYKDARVDQNILDETVGAMNWQRSHSRDNANCTVSIWDESKAQWVSKEDTGKESNTEAEKGLASDSFKRACFNWGIGRELYTAPFIWIDANNANIKKNDKGKLTCYDNFEVKSIEYDSKRNIKAITIVNAKTKAVVYGKAEAKAIKPAEPSPEQIEASAKAKALEVADLKAKVLGYINRHKMGADNIRKICTYYKVSSISQLSPENCKHYIEQLEKSGGNINE